MKTQKHAPWFRSFGGGWGVHVPSTWQGWLVVAAYFGLGLVGYLNDVRGLYYLVIIVALFVTYYLKGERKGR